MKVGVLGRLFRYFLNPNYRGKGLGVGRTNGMKMWKLQSGRGGGEYRERGVVGTGKRRNVSSCYFETVVGSANFYIS